MKNYQKTVSIVNLEQLPDLNINMYFSSILNLPTVKHFGEQYNKSISKEEFDEVMSNLKISDSAFMNSILAYSVYKDNLWTIENLDNEVEDISEHIRKSLHDPKELYNFKIWHYLKETFSKIPDTHFMRSHGLFKSKYKFDVNYSFKDGQYQALDGLAHASVVTSTSPDGKGKILHVAFRGTDFERLPSYIKKAYLNMSAYYQNFLPLEKAILDYAKDPRNNIVSVELSGHSLGGAMVQEFLKRNPNEKVELNISGYTFGSPGSEKRTFMQFLNMGYQIIKKQNIVVEDILPSMSKVDERLHEFYHTNDPVPKIGLLGYSKNGINYNLYDSVYENAKEAKLEKVSFLEKFPVFGKIITYFKEKYINSWKVRFHDSDRYINNIKNIIELNYKTYPDMVIEMNQATTQWQKFISSDIKFRQLAIKYKSAFEEIIMQSNPGYSYQEVQESLLKYRELMKYENQTNLILAQNGDGRIYSQNFLGKAPVREHVKMSLKELREKYSTQLEDRAKAFNAS